MARPTDVGNFGESLYAQFPQGVRDVDARNGYHLLIFVGAIGQIFQQQDTLAHADGIHAPWSILFDIDRIPDEGVPWLGQVVGVTVDTAKSVNDQKQQIRDHVGWQRGTVVALKKAVSQYLTDTKTVDVIERDTSPYHFTVNTYSTETPPGITYDDLYTDYLTYQAFYTAWPSYNNYWFSDPRAYIDLVIQNTKPAALQYDFTVTTGAPGTIISYQAIWIDNDTYQKVMDENQTYENVYLYP